MRGLYRRMKKLVCGFTIMEVMVASAVSVIVLGGATVALIEGMKIWQQEEIKNELNLDLEISMEYLRQDLRLSSVGIGLMAFYSTNGVDYSAISMPLSEDSNNDGLLDRNEAGNVIWNKTIVYHVRPGTPDQLLRTVFDNRSTNATASDFYAQLSNVVASTAMSDLVSCCMTGETVSSRTIFENLVNLRFTPPDIYFDGYWDDIGHAGTYNWGSLVLGPGNHQLDFVVEDKNALSTGYRVEIDKVALSASQSAREGEIFLPDNAHPDDPYYQADVVGGSVVAVERGSGWTWGGNAAISMTGTGAGSRLSLNIYNDLWCDTDFMDPGPKLLSNCTSYIDNDFRSTDPFIWDVVVAPDKGTAWTASQCGDLAAATPVVAFNTVTNLIYGGTNVPSMTVNRSGCWMRLQFQRPEGYSMIISNCVANDMTQGPSATADITFNGGQNHVIMYSDGPAVTNSDWVPNVEIDKGHNFQVWFVTDKLAADEDLDLFFGGSGNLDIKYYQNTGTKFAPAFGGWVQNWQGINEAGVTIPEFADLDNDGDYDMIVGVAGVNPRPFKFYRNEGSQRSANMVYIDYTNIVGFTTLPGSGNPSPNLVDIDADGDLDFFSGLAGGQILISANTGTVYNMKWAPAVYLYDVYSNMINVGGYAAPEFADIDGDGDYDLFSGNQGDGGIKFWQNTGTNTAPIWTPVTNFYGGLTNGSTYCVARFADIDYDGDLDLYVGNLAGQLTTYVNTGTVNNALWAPAVVQGGITAGRAAPALCNIDGDRFGLTTWSNQTVTLGSINGVSGTKLYGLSGMEVGYARESLYLSGIYDTTMSSPNYNELNWTQFENKNKGWDVDLRIRSSNDRKMRDLTDIDWQDASPGDGGYMDDNTGNSLASLPKKRYVQYEARFKCNEDNKDPAAHTNSVPGAKLTDVTIDWPGPTGLCDLLVTFGRGPDCGVVNVTVDGQDFIKGVQIDMTIFKEGRTGMNSANGVLEVRPLNTGK